MASMDISIEKLRAFKEKAKDIMEIIMNADDNVVIISIGNPDNLCAAGILILSLQRLGIGSHTIFIEDTKVLEKRLKKFDYSLFFFIGLQVRDIPKYIIEKDKSQIFIVNHEISLKGKKDELKENLHVLSLEQFKIPKNAIANAGMLYFLTERFDEGYKKYAGLAIIGALSKKQVNPQNQKLNGLNIFVLNEGKDEGYLAEIQGTRIAGRESQPIHLALKYSISPYFKGLTGNESACTSFVSRLGIQMKNQEDNWRTISSLTIEETQKFNSALIPLMETKSQTLNSVSKLIGPIYILSKEMEKNQTRNAEEFLWVLDGACQLKKQSLALAVILGDRENIYDQLIRDLENYHGKASQIIEEIASNPEIIKHKEYFRVLEGSEILDLETAQLVTNALVESGIIPIDVPLLVIIKEQKSCYMYIHESPLNIKKGFLIYHTVLELKKENKIENIMGDEKLFKFKYSEEKSDEIINSIKQALEYHHKGDKKEEEVKEEKLD